MLQNQVLKTPRRESRRGPYDPRTAALAVAASAVCLLTIPVPPESPQLMAGFGRPRASAALMVRADNRHIVQLPARAQIPAAPGGPAEESAPTSDQFDETASPPVEGIPTMAGHSRYARASGGDTFPRHVPIRARHAPRASLAPATAERMPPAAWNRLEPSIRSFVAFEPRERIGVRPQDQRNVARPALIALAGSLRGPVKSGDRALESRESGRRPSARAAHSRVVNHAAGEEASASARTSNRRKHKTSRPRPAPRRRVKTRPAPRPAKRRLASERLRPLLLSKLIGSRALHSPPASLEPPPQPALRPARDDAGALVPDGTPALSVLDAVDPASFSRDHSQRAHWDAGVWHDGAERGLMRDGQWLPLYRDRGRWWAFAGGGAQLRHDGVWWMKERGIWLVIHDGRPWAWRSFQDWDAEGLFQPGTGTEMVYSKDFARVAMITPGDGAVVYDAVSGERLAEIPEDRMPARRRPRRPALEAETVNFDR